ncbi:MAG TPA: 50S ribosomal protein L13 [Candidatus Saccharimonadales bacterium]|nr:50S ribosomal protein L13 [Candidatus Saccharimonadales bacterium]
MKTYSAKPSDVTRKWYVVDASEAPLGRVATKVAKLLTGKDKPMFTHHIDTGDFVVIINADKVTVTGTKMDNKMYYSHSGFPGGLKEATMREKMEKDPTHAIMHAVRGMLPVNKLRDARLARLKIYAGTEHNHAAQKPEVISVKPAAKAVKTKEAK